MTSKRIAKKAAKLLAESPSYIVREVAGSDLARRKKARKQTRKKATPRAPQKRVHKRSTRR